MTTKTKKNVEALEKSLNSSNVVETLDQLEALISRVHKAQRIFATFSQEKVDAIFKAAVGKSGPLIYSIKPATVICGLSIKAMVPSTTSLRL